MLAGSMGFLTNGKGRITHGTLMGHLLPTSSKSPQQGPTTEDVPRPPRHGGLGVVGCCQVLGDVVYNIEIKGLKILSPYGGPGSNPGSGTSSMDIQVLGQ